MNLNSQGSLILAPIPTGTINNRVGANAKACKGEVREERPIEVCGLKKPRDLGKASRTD